jgi:anti-sigma factor RsiW
MKTANCEQPAIAAWARDYLVGALGEDDASRFEDHLAGCPACAARVERLHRALESLPSPSPCDATANRARLRCCARAKRWR